MGRFKEIDTAKQDTATAAIWGYLDSISNPDLSSPDITMNERRNMFNQKTKGEEMP